MDTLSAFAPCALFSLRESGEIVAANTTMERWLAYPVRLTTMHFDQILSRAGQIFWRTHIHPLLAVEGHADEIYLGLRDYAGKSLPILANFSRHVSPDGPLIMGAALLVHQRDQYENAILAAKQAANDAARNESLAREQLERTLKELEDRQRELLSLNAELREHVRHDRLTGLHNRSAFEQELALLIAQLHRRPERGVSLLTVDIDHFKQINDTHGHPYGDEVLRSIAQLLARSVRPNDLVARYGGEEFMILLPRTDLHEALQVAERIRAAVEATSLVTISVGVAWSQDRETEGRALILAADQALYEAKRNGRNQVRAAGQMQPNRE